MKKNDWLLAAGILAVAAVLLCFQILRGQMGEKAYARVTVDGEEFGSYSLDEDQIVEIHDTNRLVIEDGAARMEWADCPDQICVGHRAVSYDGESIICLPNKVVVSVKSEEGSGLDGVVR